MNSVELRHLQALIAVAEEGTFTDAAIRLGVSQPAVSRLIAGLEELCGARLVERTTRSVALTERGALAYRGAAVAVSAVNDVIEIARGQSRPLRLGFAWSALGSLTTQVLQRWRTENPEVPLEVHRFDERAAGLLRAAVDIAVIRGKIDEPRLVAHQILSEPRVAALPLGHRLASRRTVDLLELVEDTVLTTATGTTTVDLWPEDQQPRSTLRVDNVDEWLTEIAGGLAVGVTTESTTTQHAHPGIRFVPLTGASTVPVYLAWSSTRHHPATERFVSLVERIVAGH